MKKELENINNDDFGKFEDSELNDLSTVKGGTQTSTTRTKTLESSDDQDTGELESCGCEVGFE